MIESNVNFYSRVFPTEFVKAQGSRIWNKTGNIFIDFLSGAGTLNYGHNHSLIKEKLLKYITENGIIHALDMNTEARISFLERFKKIILESGEYFYKIQFPGPTGTNAVEAAFVLAEKITGRSKIGYFENSFHGMTQRSKNVSAVLLGNKTTGKNNILLPYCNSTNIDKGLTQIKNKVEILKKNNSLPAAIILEIVQGEGGINVAEKLWLKELFNICRENEILTILDDIQAGIGRCGTFFSFEMADIIPDIILLSKSLSGIGLPLSAVLIKPELDIWEPGEYSGTFRSNCLALVAANAALDIWDDGDTFKTQIKKTSCNIEKKLTMILKKHKIVKRKKGIGVFRGLECISHEVAKCIQKEAFKKGLIIELAGQGRNVIKILPPLTISSSTLEKGFTKLDEAIRVAKGGK